MEYTESTFNIKKTKFKDITQFKKKNLHKLQQKKNYHKQDDYHLQIAYMYFKK